VNDMLGFVSLLFIAILVLIFTLRWPDVKKILWAAFIVRSVLAVAHYYGIPLPDSGSDAVSFEANAWNLAQLGLNDVIASFKAGGSGFISWIIAIFYSITERSQLMAQSVSVLMGTGTVLVGWRLSYELGGKRAATIVGWMLAFFPTLVLYSSLIMREPYVTFFLVLALYSTVRWVRYHRLTDFFSTTIWFVIAMFFHGGMIVGLFVFALFAFVDALVLVFKFGRSNLPILFVTVMIPFGLALFVSLEYSVPKLGTFNEFFNKDRVISAIHSRTKKTDDSLVGAEYPEWTKPNSASELIWLAPVRVVYFLFSPFPWDMRKLLHVVGGIDSLLYLVFSYLVWRHRTLIWEHRFLRPLLLILIAYIVVFSFGTGNFGSGIRHRSKFIVIFVILLSPFFRSRSIGQHRSQQSLFFYEKSIDRS